MPRGYPGSWKHGTRSGYRNGCRCDACRQAQRDAAREWRASFAHLKPKPEPFPHGEPRGYWRGCRCRPCTNAACAYESRRKFTRSA